MTGRNDPCPCGSGKKYKRCCWDADRSGRTSEVAEAARERERAAYDLVACFQRGEVDGKVHWSFTLDDTVLCGTGKITEAILAELTCERCAAKPNLDAVNMLVDRYGIIIRLDDEHTRQGVKVDNFAMMRLGEKMLAHNRGLQAAIAKGAGRGST